MNRDGTLPWTDDQWASIDSAVQDAARQTRVAASFLPLTGPLPPGQSFVAASAMQTQPWIDQTELRGLFGDPTVDAASIAYFQEGRSGRAVNRSNVEGSATLPLVRLSVPVYLKRHEIEDPQLQVARQIFARAAAVLGRLEDSVIFNGLQVATPTGLRATFDSRPVPVQPPIYLIDGPADADFEGMIESRTQTQVPTAVTNDRTLVRAVAEAVSELEQAGYYAPFACIVGQTLFNYGQTVAVNSATAGDRISPYLGGGPYLRCSVIQPTYGVTVALGGAPVDLVVGSDLAAHFIQLTQEPRYLFSVQETIRFRIKDRTIVPPCPPWRILNGPDPAPAAGRGGDGGAPGEVAARAPDEAGGAEPEVRGEG